MVPKENARSSPLPNDHLTIFNFWEGSGQRWIRKCKYIPNIMIKCIKFKIGTHQLGQPFFGASPYTILLHVISYEYDQI